MKAIIDELKANIYLVSDVLHKEIAGTESCISPDLYLRLKDLLYDDPNLELYTELDQELDQDVDGQLYMELGQQLERDLLDLNLIK